MLQIKNALISSLGKKFILALTGLGLGLFVVIHLLGNLTLFKSSGDSFNSYAYGLEKMGALLVIAEIGLAAFIIVHAITAIWLKFSATQSRPVGYRAKQSKGITYSNIASRNMIVTGLILLGFIILHLYQFRFGPGIAEGYSTTVDGVEMRDLHKLVTETFHNPLHVGVYVLCMIFLGFHLRHGYWSMFQSLGVMTPRYSRIVYFGGTALAVLLAVGFLLIPVWIYFT